MLVAEQHQPLLLSPAPPHAPSLQKDLWHTWVHPHGAGTTGALDLGGASTQIAFAVGDTGMQNASDVVQVALYGYTYVLYTHSFQCYGRNEAEKRFLALLLQVRGAQGFPTRPGWGSVCLGPSAVLGVVQWCTLHLALPPLPVPSSSSLPPPLLSSSHRLFPPHHFW